MENATDAIIMAGSVLLLIIALTVSISSFTSLKVQVDEVISSRDQIQMAQDDKGLLNYITSKENDVRVVETDAIISSIRRMRKENYEIYVVGLDLTGKDKLSKLKVESDELVLKTQKYDESTELFSSSDTIVKFSISGARAREIYTLNNVDLDKETLNGDLMKDLYSATKDKKYKEYIGIYQDETSEGVSEANKITHKIITFVQQ